MMIICVLKLYSAFFVRDLLVDFKHGIYVKALDMVNFLTYKGVAPSEIERMNFTILSFWYNTHKKIDKAVKK